MGRESDLQRSQAEGDQSKLDQLSPELLRPRKEHLRRDGRRCAPTVQQLLPGIAHNRLTRIEGSESREQFSIYYRGREQALLNARIGKSGSACSEDDAFVHPGDVPQSTGRTRVSSSNQANRGKLGEASWTLDGPRLRNVRLGGPRADVPT